MLTRRAQRDYYAVRMAIQTYSLYGMTLHSQFPLPGLPAGADSAAPDVEIRAGKVPPDLHCAEVRDTLYQANARRVLFDIPSIGRYLVSDGREIVVEPFGDDDAARLFLLDTAVAPLLHQRGVLALHASAVATAQGAVLFAGVAGTGKSTLAAALDRRGSALLADTAAVIRFDGQGQPWILPGYPQIDLWQDTLDRLDIANRQALRPGIAKYAVPPSRFQASPLALKRIYVLGTLAGNEAVIDPLPGMRGILALTPLVYRLRLAVAMGVAGRLERMLADVVRRVPVAGLVRPEEGFRLDRLVERVEREWSV
jgi:hypothetical protein